MEKSQNNKRILIFSLTYFPDFIGGAEVAVKEITDRLGEGFSFDLITLRLSKELPKYERIGNVNIYRVGSVSKKRIKPGRLPLFLTINKYLMLFTAWRKAEELQKKRGYDAIWSIMATYNSFAALFFKLRHRHIPFLLTLQEGDPIPFIKKRALPLWPLFKMIFTKADHIQTISNYLKEFAQDMGARSPVSVIPNGVNVDIFSKEVTIGELNRWFTPMKRSPGDKFLVTSSRLVKKNGIKDVINALPLLPSNIKFAIAGDGEEKEALKAQVESLKLENRVSFLGYVNHKELPQLLKASDIFIRSSLSEGFGNSFVEAMAAGLPVIATRVGGIADFLIDGETGFVCKPEDPESIKEAIERIIKNPETVREVKENAFRMVTEKYDWEIVASQMKEVFAKLTNLH